MARTPLKIFAVVLLLVGVLSVGVADYPDYRVSERAQPSTSQDIELTAGWALTEAGSAAGSAESISTNGYDTSDWTRVPRMPGTVLQILEDTGVYPNLYYGTNLRTEVPQDLYKKDWWYRTTFTAPAAQQTYLLDFPGVNYRAEIWLNGHRVADNRQVVGMYADHELDVTPWIAAGEPNTLAVKVTPERAIQDVDGVELADSWYDWINFRYLGYRNPDGNSGASFVADRNAGVWKPVHLKAFGPVGIGPAAVNTELPLPATDSARLTVYASLRNYTGVPARGVLNATITRTGKRPIRISQPVSLQPGEEREVVLSPGEFEQLTLRDPDLWWPYTMGRPDLYDLKLDFVQNNTATATSSLRFGVRTVSQGRDGGDEATGGDFYLRVNGRDFPVRGATYTPDLLYRYDPDRDAAILSYTKDLGLNMLRLESKIASPRLVEMADEIGIPMMYGWMCCNQWEKWQQWDDEDHRVANASLRSQIAMLRSHASVFVWANSSDGRPPEDVRKGYHRILEDLHWQNAVVDTVSALARDRAGDAPGAEDLWDGIQMSGPYSWRPPSYWFAGTYPATRGSTAEQGDNEHIPPFASLRRFIPPDKLWPINDTWYFHAGADPLNSTLTNVRTAIDLRYGLSSSAQVFADKAQLAHYENTRAQFEAFAAGGWDRNKMTIYWMLNSHWPSFFGNLFDYYLRPGGAYYGAKKGLRPLSVVFDSYATGDHQQAKVTVVNQSPERRKDLRVRVRIYDLAGKIRLDRTVDDITVNPGSYAPALTLGPGPTDSPVFFVRCELQDADGTITENVYWQSRQIDDVGPVYNDTAFESKQISWADMTALNTIVKPALEISAESDPTDGTVTVRLRNPSPQIAFFQRAELLTAREGDEILPIEYDDNYLTVFPGETAEIHGRVPPGGPKPAWVRVTGYGGAPSIAPIR